MKKNIEIYILAAFIIVATVVFLVMLAVKATPPENKDAIMMALGSVLSAFGTVVGYFFGSSKGSADKTDAMLKNPPLTVPEPKPTVPVP